MTKSPLVIFGIPTVARQSEFYLFKTLFSLKKHLKKSEESQCQFVIQISEVNESKALQMIDTLNKTFHSDIQEGLIEVILIDTLYYPTISTVSKTKESAERVYWRTKQNLDLIYLMWFCSQRKKSTFYVQLEDDIITRVSCYILVFWKNFAQYIDKRKPVILSSYANQFGSPTSGFCATSTFLLLIEFKMQSMIYLHIWFLNHMLTFKM